MDNVYLKPAPLAGGGVALVRDPLSMKPLDADGEWKPKNQYWTRRIKDKDVIVSTPTEATAVASRQSATPIPPVEPMPFARCGTCPEPVACQQRGVCAHTVASG